MSNPKNQHVARTIAALHRSNAMAGSESVVYVALGDSVTAGWLEHGILDSDAAYPSLLRRRLAALFPRAMISVVNAGLGGDNTEGVLARLERDCLRHGPHLVTLCLGLNDARKGLEGLDAFKTNLAEIARRVRAETAADLLLVTPNTRGDEENNAAVAEYVRATRALARLENIGLADVHAVFQGAIRMGAAPADLLSNRVSHPTREGHAVFAGTLIEFFQP